MDPRKWLFDTRVVRRNLDRGVLTWKAYKDYLKSTPDLAGEYEVITLDADDAPEDGAADAAEDSSAEAAPDAVE
jgi:hypothetical protein